MRRVWVQLFLAPLVAACGIIGGIEDITVVGGPPIDAGLPVPPDDSGNPRRDGALPLPEASTDASTDADASTRCDPLAPFPAPVAIASLNSASDDSTPRFSPDELTVYLASTRPGHLGGGSIYTATRSTPTGAFGTPALMPVINTNGGVVYHLAITGDGLRIFLQVAGGGPTDIYLGTRPSTAVVFGTPAPLANVNSPNASHYEFFPFVTADGVDLYFSSNRSGSFVLYHSASSAGVFAVPTAVAGTVTGNVAIADTAPVLSADQLTIYFASTRTVPGSTAYDLYVARRTTVAGAFATPTLVAELNDGNAAASDIPSWLSADDCRLYMSSDRLTPGGAFDVYVATRTP